MAKILRNTTASPVAVGDVGITIAASSSYTIPAQDYLLWAASSNVVTYVGNGTLVVNDGSFDLDISDGIDVLKGVFPSFQLSSPTIVELTATLANTEYDYTLPAGVRQFELQARGMSLLRVRYVSAGTTRTIFPGNTYKEQSLKLSGGMDLFLEASKAGEVIEITYWT